MLSRIDHGTIDPTNLTPEQNQLLTKLIQQSSTTPLFDYKKTYSLLVHDTDNNQIQRHQFKLSHYLLVRARKQNKTGNRIEVIHPSDLLGRGGYGVVFKSSGVLIMETIDNNNQLRFKKKARAIKQQCDKYIALPEYENASRLDFLAVKPLTIFTKKRKKKKPETNYIMAMRFFNGRNLFQIKQDEDKDIITIDTDKRLSIMRAILCRIEKLHQAGVIHRDLKSENIMVDDEVIHPIDFSHCKFIHDENSHPGSFVTPPFSPPEQFHECFDKDAPYDEKSDNYTIGKVLAEWLGATTAPDKVSDHLEKLRDNDWRTTRKAIYEIYKNYSQYDTIFNYDNFKQGDLSEEHANSIKYMLEQLSLADMNMRLALATAINMIDKIIEERKLPKPACKL